MSGGRATVFKKRGEDLRHQAGDIVAVHPDGHALTKRFFVEVKHYENLDIASFFLKQTGRLWKFWLKAVKQAKAHNLRPLMIAKQNNFPTLLIIRQGDDWELFEQKHTDWKSARGTGEDPPNVYLFDEVLETRFISKTTVPKRRLSNKEIEAIVGGEDEFPFSVRPKARTTLKNPSFSGKKP